MAESITLESRPTIPRVVLKRIVASSGLLAPCALFLIALAPRVWLVWLNGFDGLYGQDAYAYYGFAKEMYSALARVMVPPPFWWPIGYPALLDFGFLVLGTGVRSAQITTLLCGALVAPLAFLLAREAMPGRRGNVTGLVAGAIVAVSGQLVQSSIVIMSDAPALMWATLAAWLLLRYRRYGQVGALALSAAALGLAVLTRWENLGFAVVWVFAVLVPGSRENRVNKTPSVIHLLQVAPHFLLGWTIFAIMVLPQLLYQVQNAAPLAGQTWLEGWRPTNILARSVDTVDGHFYYALPVGLFYSQVLFHPAYLFPLLTPFLLLGAWQLVSLISVEPAASILFVGWIAAPLFFLIGIPYENFRFGLGFFVPVSVLAGMGVAWVLGRLDEISLPSPISMRGRLSHRTLSLAVILILALSLIGTTAWEPRVLAPVLAEKQNEVSYTNWLIARLPRSAALYTFGLTEAVNAYSSLEAKDLSEEMPDRITADIRARAPTFLFVDVKNIETQWRGKVLEENLHILRDQVGLAEIGSSGPFTLFRVGVAR